MQRNRHQDIDDLIKEMPTPIAFMLRRAQNSKSSLAMFQNTSQYLAEMGTALAAAYWLGKVVDAQKTLSPALCGQLQSLVERGASFGKWVGILREASAQMGGLDALQNETVSDELWDSFINNVKGHIDDLGEVALSVLSESKRVKKRGLIGVLELFVVVRNKVFGHGSMVPENVARNLTQPAMQLLMTVFSSKLLFEGSTLSKTSIDVLGEGEIRFWENLKGLDAQVALHVQSLPKPETVSEHCLYFTTRAGDCISLGPWFVLQEDESGLQKFGIFQNAKNYKRNDTDITCKKLEYLDYMRGLFREDVHRDAFLAFANGHLNRTLDKEAKIEEEEEDEWEIEGEKFGDFVIQSELGRGAMGVVYRATQMSLGRTVALKVLPHNLAQDPLAISRFRREVDALARCDHSNVVRILASGIEEERPWYVMELIEGSDLQGVFKTLINWQKDEELTAAHLTMASVMFLANEMSNVSSDGTISIAANIPKEVRERTAKPQQGKDIYRSWATLFAGVSTGLLQLHKSGLIHRDIKPANLMLTDDGERLVLMDLGLARAIDSTGTLTQHASSSFVGTARYAAPEQITSNLTQDIDERADIYSLAATLYEMLALQSIYPAQSIEELLQKKLNEEPTPLRQVNEKIPEDLELIVAKALSRNPIDRYDDVEAFANDLLAFVAGEPISARPPSTKEVLQGLYRKNQTSVHIGILVLSIIIIAVATAFYFVNLEKQHAEHAEAVALDAKAKALEAQRLADLSSASAEHLAGYMIDEMYFELERMGKLDLIEKFIGELEQHYAGQEQLTQAQQERFQFIQIKKARVWYTQGKFKESKALLQSLEEELQQQEELDVYFTIHISSLLEQIDYDFEGNNEIRISEISQILKKMNNFNKSTDSVEHILLYLDLLHRSTFANINENNFSASDELIAKTEEILNSDTVLKSKPDLYAFCKNRLRMLMVWYNINNKEIQKSIEIGESILDDLEYDLKKYPQYLQLNLLKYETLKALTFAWFFLDSDRNNTISVANDALKIISYLNNLFNDNQYLLIEHTKALNNSSATYTRVGDLKNSFEMNMKAVEIGNRLLLLEPENLRYRDNLHIYTQNLAECHFDIGDFEEVISLSKQGKKELFVLLEKNYKSLKSFYALYIKERAIIETEVLLGKYAAFENIHERLPQTIVEGMTEENTWDKEAIFQNINLRIRLSILNNNCSENKRLLEQSQSYNDHANTSRLIKMLPLSRDTHYQCGQLSPSWTDGLELLNLRKDVYTKTPEILQRYAFWDDKHSTNAHILYYGYEKVALDVQTEILRELEAIYVENPDFFTRRISYIEALLQYAEVLYRNGQSVEALTQLDKLDLEIGKALEVSPKFVKSKLLSVKGNILRAKVHQKRKRMDDALLAINKAEMAMPEIYEGSPIAEHQFVHLQIQIVKGQILFAKNGFDDLDAQNRILTSHTELTKLQSENKLFPPYNQLLSETQFMLGQEQTPLDRLVLSEQELAAFAQMNLADVVAGKTTESEASRIHIKVNPIQSQKESKTSNKVQFRLPK